VFKSEGGAIDFSDTRRKENSFQRAALKRQFADVLQFRVGSKCDFTQARAVLKRTSINGHERRRKKNGLQPKTFAKSTGSDSLNALLEAQVQERRNMVKRSFPNLANSGRDNNALRFSKAMHNFPQVHEEMARH
jgi:hypothetical protein